MSNLSLLSFTLLIGALTANQSQTSGGISPNTAESCLPAIEAVNLIWKPEYANLQVVSCNTQVVAGVIYYVGLHQDPQAENPYCEVSIIEDLFGGFSVFQNLNNPIDCTTLLSNQASVSDQLNQ